jgi:transposase
MTTLWIGIDMAKANLEAVALWQSESTSLGQFPNEAAGFAALAAQVQAEQERRGAAAVQWVVEPTGGYELPLVAFAHEAGWAISLPNPRQVRQWAKGSGQRAKTDRQDALLLARFGAAQQPAPQHPLAVEVSELDSLLQRRQDLEQMVQQEKNRLEALCGGGPQGAGIATPVTANLERVIQALQEALHEVERAIAQHLRQHPQLHDDAQRLLALPGIGPKVVLPLLVQLHRWQTLTAGQGTAKGLTALVGLDPQPYESGRSVRKRSSISKMGNATLRRLLYMGALSAVHGHNPLHAFYERLVGRGKAKKLVVVAAARKLLTWAWTLFSRQSDWNPDFHTI